MLTVSSNGTPGIGVIASMARAGRSLLAAGRVHEAQQALELGIFLEENGAPPVAEVSAEARFDLANLLHAQGKHAEAAAQYEALVARFPEHAEAHYNLGVTELMRGRIAEAAASYRRALALDPAHPNAHNNLALLLQLFGMDTGARAHALAHFEASGTPDARYNMALLLQENGNPEEAAAIYRALLEMDPDNHEVRNNLANIALAEGRTRDALEEYQRILSVVPDFVDAHRNAAMAELVLGNFREGFREYEWRFRPSPGRQGDWIAPLWDGSPIAGKTILLHAEQGLGDTIQFARFVPNVAALGGNVVLETQRPVTDLLKSLSGTTAVIARGDRLPDHDVQYPLMSLPYRLGITLDDLPATVPYLSACPERIEYWRRRIDTIAGRDELRVGLAWSGNARYKDNSRRSIPRKMLETLAQVSGIRWFGLQKDEAGAAIPGLALEWLEGPDTTFTDAAAIITNLDLVISVDTSVAHLAGALARPVWLLASKAPDWRWMRDRPDSPWYPTMRLFRQSRAGEWGPVLERVRIRLAALIEESY